MTNCCNEKEPYNDSSCAVVRFRSVQVLVDENCGKIASFSRRSEAERRNEEAALVGDVRLEADVVLMALRCARSVARRIFGTLFVDTND